MSARLSQPIHSQTGGEYGLSHSDGDKCSRRARHHGKPDASVLPVRRRAHRFGPGRHPGTRRPRRHGVVAAVHFRHGQVRGLRLPARHGVRHGNVGRGAGGVVRRAGNRRVRRNDPGRPSVGPKRRGGTSIRRVLHVVHVGRPVRRGPARHFDTDPAACDALSRLAGTSVLHGFRPVDGVGAVGRLADARRRGGLFRSAACDGRVGSADRHAALDARFALPVGRPADCARHHWPVRSARARRHGDRADRHRHRIRSQGQHDRRPDAGGKGRFPQLVAGAALFLAGDGDRRHAGPRRFGGGLDRLRPRGADRERGGGDFRHRRHPRCDRF